MLLYMFKHNARAVLKYIMESQRTELRVAEIANATQLCPATVRSHLKVLHFGGYITLKRPNTATNYSFEVHEKAYEEMGLEYPQVY